MSRSNKSKIAVTLLGALAFGANDASAMDSGVKNLKSVSAANSNFSASKDTKLGSRNERIEKGVSVLKRGLFKKVLIGFGAGAVAVEAANEIMAGVTRAKGKEPEKLIEGKYSIVHAVSLMLKGKKNNQNPDLDEKEDAKSDGVQNSILDKKDEKIDEKDLEIFLKKFLDADSNQTLQMKENLIRVYKKVKKGHSIDDFRIKSKFYTNKEFGDNSVANAILNYIAGEKKFDTDLEVASVSILRDNFYFSIAGDEINKYFLFFKGGKFTVIGGSQTFLDFEY